MPSYFTYRLLHVKRKFGESRKCLTGIKYLTEKEVFVLLISVRVDFFAQKMHACFFLLFVVDQAFFHQLEGSGYSSLLY